MKKVSFDFDGCIGDSISLQEYAIELISKGIDVWIVTTRWDRTSKYCDPEYYKFHKNDSWLEVHGLARELGIPIKNIVFTNYTWKYDKFFKFNNDFIFHIDDNSDELRNLSKVGIVGIAYPSGGWKQKCEKLLWTDTLEKKTES